MTRLLIIRHGNTFRPDETPTRVGGRTDLPLVESGIEQAKALGQHFKKKKYIPDVVFTSELVRTKETASYILGELQHSAPVTELSMLNEVDYGPDENKVEEEVIARIGTEAIELWDKEAVVPPGWEFDPKACLQSWQNMGQELVEKYKGQLVMVVTSNGVGRFAPHITNNYDAFKKEHIIKLKTGAYGCLQHDGKGWHIKEWGIRP